MIRLPALPLRNILSVFLLVLLFNSYLPAQEQGLVKFITMEDAISKALVDNNIIKANQYQIKKSNWDVKRAWAELFPTLSFNTRYNWIDQQTFAERDFRQYLPPELSSQIPQTVFQESYSSSFNVNFPFFNGVLINGLSIAYEKETMSEQLAKSSREQVIFNVVTSYLNVLKNKEIVNLQREYLELSRLNYEKAQRLFEANRYSQNEALRWKIDYQQQKSVVVSSEADFRSSLLSLGRLINVEFDEETIFTDNIPIYLEDEKDSFDIMSKEQILNLVNLSDSKLIKVNAALAASKSSEEISRLLHKNSYSSFMPNIDLNYSYGWRENNTIDFDDYSPKSLMINFNLPIFSGFQNYASLKSSLYEYKKSQEEFKDQLLNTKLLLNNVANNIINIKSQLELMKSNVEFSLNNYKIVEQQKEKGLVSNIEYIDAKLNLQNANIDYIGNSYLLIITIVELNYLTGNIDQIIN